MNNLGDYIDFLYKHSKNGEISTFFLNEIIDKLSNDVKRDNLIVNNEKEVEIITQILSSVIRNNDLDRKTYNKTTDFIGLINRYWEKDHLNVFKKIRPLELYMNSSSDKPQEKIHKKDLTNVYEKIKQMNFNENEKILFFIGAGASKPKPSNIPTVNELLPELWKKSAQMGNKPLEKLEEWCNENEIENIEEMLTAVTISNFIIESPKIRGLLNSVLYPDSKTLTEIPIRDVDSVLHLENMLNTFFSLLVGTMLQAEPNEIHNSIAKYASDYENVDILTTNYDTCIDQALDNFEVNYNNVLDNEKSTTPLDLVKMHGSINWFYCNTCQSVYSPSIDTIKEFTSKNGPYVIIGMCEHCNAQVKQFIIPPVAHKYLTHPPIVQVWDHGRIILNTAKTFIIIGYSFSDADDYIAKMLVKSIGNNPKKSIIIIDQDEEVIDRCKSFIRSHIKNFDEDLFFPLCGDALEIVPELLTIITETMENKKSSAKDK